MEIAKFLSLQNLDLYWQVSIAQSTLIALLEKSFHVFASKIQGWTNTTAIASFLEKVSFYLTILLFAVIPLPQFAKEKEGLAGILIIAFLFWFSGIILGNKYRRSPTAIDALVVLFFAVNIIATCASHYFSYSMHGLLKLSVYILAYFLFSAQLANNQKRQIILIGTLLLTGTFVSIYGLYQYHIGVAPLATWEDPNIENQATRIYATFNNPNLLAGYLLPLIMLSVSISLTAAAKRKMFLSLITLFITSLLTTALILTGSRGAYIGLAACLLILLVTAGIIAWRQSKGKKRLLIFTVVLIAITAFVLHKLPGFEQRIISIFVGREHSSNSFRLNVWHSCFSMFKDNWLIGIGVGNQAFRLAYGLYMRSGFDALAAYSVPLEIAVEGGIFALLSFAMIIISTLSRAHLSFLE